MHWLQNSWHWEGNEIVFENKSNNYRLGMGLGVISIKDF